ncbi:hypothetical protein HDU67_000536 [Dinochytrium kinnereticum]|nr:hypothetical protein HDU67_000536 [Dinochytrium kinnereticum]
MGKPNFSLVERIEKVQMEMETSLQSVRELEKERNRLRDQHRSAMRESHLLMDRYRNMSKDLVEHETRIKSTMHRIAEKRRKLLILKSWKHNAASLTKQQKEFVSLVIEPLHPVSKDSDPSLAAIDTLSMAAHSKEENRRFTPVSYIKELAASRANLDGLIERTPKASTEGLEGDDDVSFSALFLGKEKNMAVIAELQKKLRHHLQNHAATEQLRKSKVESEKEYIQFLEALKRRSNYSQTLESYIGSTSNLEGVFAIDKAIRAYRDELLQRVKVLRENSELVEVLRKTAGGLADEIIKETQDERLPLDTTQLHGTIAGLEGCLLHISEKLRRVVACPLMNIKEHTNFRIGYDYAATPMFELCRRLEIRPFKSDAAILKHIHDIKKKALTLQQAIQSSVHDAELFQRKAGLEESLDRIFSENQAFSSNTQDCISNCKAAIEESVPKAIEAHERVCRTAASEYMAFVRGGEEAEELAARMLGLEGR